MNVWQVIDHNPILVFLVAIVAALTVGTLANCAFLCWNRLMRHLNVCQAGWPPPHCDADGDFKPPEKSGQAAE